ncbi:prolyl hydroxylase family protein [Brevundimonas sp.]|uniref:prolyl hydroxylase family protein n=1 Tax=Brevundimonas sp. TaxID=1871086 RepID=UPI0035B4DCF6
MAASGFGIPHDWQNALALLALSARQGYPLAVDQVRLLGLDEHHFQLQEWLAPPPLQTVADSPAIVLMPGFVTTPICDWLQSRARGLLNPASVFDANIGQAQLSAGRTNSAAQFDVDTMDVITTLVRQRIANAAGMPLISLEWSQVLLYEVGQTFDWHVDYLDPAVPGFAQDIARRGQRIATCLVYLNDDFEGGETAFTHEDRRHRGRAGDAIMWANTLADGEIDPRTVHAGLPPTAGQKWVFSQWMRDRAQF